MRIHTGDSLRGCLNPHSVRLAKCEMYFGARDSIEVVLVVGRGSVRVGLLFFTANIVANGDLDALACEAFGQLGGLGHAGEASRAVDGEWLCERLGEDLATDVGGRRAHGRKAGRPNRDELECKSELTFLANAEIGKDKEAGSGAVKVTSNIGAGYQAALEHPGPWIRRVVGFHQDRVGMRASIWIFFAKRDLKDEVGAVLSTVDRVNIVAGGQGSA